MPKKSKKTTKKTKKGPSWPELAGAIATKIEKEAEKNPPKAWSWSWTCARPKGHFLPALIFAITAVYILGQAGYMAQIPMWIKAILVLAFAFMFS